METKLNSRLKLFIRAYSNRPLKSEDRNGPSHAGGFTLTELLAAAIIATIIVGFTAGVIAEQRRQFITDRTRADINQNLRLSMDFVGADIKQAGERLEADSEMPAISIIDGGSNPDILVLQRKLITEVLPVCQTLTAGSSASTIDVALATNLNNPSVTNCVFSDGDSDSLTDSLNQWRDYRCSQDNTANCDRTVPLTATQCQVEGGSDRECVSAYIYDPTADRGEFFVYSYEDSGNCTDLTGDTCNRIYRSDGGNWQNTYSYDSGGAAASQPRIYILEERQYRLVPDANTSRQDDYVLQLRVNRQNPQKIVNQLSNFQVIGRTSAGDVSEFNADLSQSNDDDKPQFISDWQQLQYLRVDLTATPPDSPVSVDNLTLSSQFFPRNILSK